MDPNYPVWTPPLYAIFIAIGSFIFGQDQLPIKVLQILADSGTTCVVMLIAREIVGFRSALVSGALLVVYPFSIYASLYIGTETFFTFLLSCFILPFLRAKSSPRLGWYLLAGVTLGAATLMRGTTQFMPLLTLVLLVLLNRPISKQVIIGYLGFCLSFALIIAPWTVRNYLVLKEFVPVATASSVFLQGSREDFLTIDGKIVGFPKYFSELEGRGISRPPRDAGPVVWDRYRFRAGLENYRIRAENDPLSMIPFMLNKFGRIWYATESGRDHAIILLANIPLYILAVVGVISIVTQRRAPRSIWILLLIIAYFAALHLISLPLFRYALPIMPYVIVLASAGVLVCFDWRNRATVWQTTSQ